MNHSQKTILEILRDTSFIDGLVEFSNNGDELRDFFQKRSEDIQRPRYVISVIGVQGSGKSSFINALLMDTAILPRDVAETTCVPTEITYSNSPEPNAVVHFKNGSSKKVIASENELKRFLHNEANPGNKLGVSKVIVESNSPLLKSGIVVVDLPGMGSLTDSNMETTINYIKTSSAGIYLLRTVPPLTRLEQSQLSAIWPSLSKIWFVQNRWNDESLQEAQDGQLHNQLTLSEIKKKNPLIPDHDIVVSLIDLYKALDLGVLSGNDKNIANSGLKDFTETFSQTSSSWSTELINNTRRELLILTHRAQAKAQEENARLAMNTSNTIKELELKEEEFKLNFSRAKEGIVTALKKAQHFREDITNLSNELLDNYKKEMRNVMREIIRAGVVDGVSLDSAYKDNNDELMAEVQERLSKEINVFVDDFSHFCEENIPETSRYMGEAGPGIKGKLKIEKAGGVLAGIGGVAVGALWLVPLLGNPVGWAFVGVVAAASLVGSLIGWVTGKGASTVRKNLAEKEVFALIEEHAISLKQKIRLDIQNFISGLDENFSTWLSKRQDDFLSEKKKILNEVEMAESEKCQRSCQLSTVDRLFTQISGKLEN